MPVDEISNNGYDLSINKYKEVEYEEVKYEALGVILDRIKKLEGEITQGLEELEAMLLE